MSDAFAAVPEGKPYSEADVTKLMESMGVTRDAAIGTFETWISGNGQFLAGLGNEFPEVFKAHMAAKGFNPDGSLLEKTGTEEAAT